MNRLNFIVILCLPIYLMATPDWFYNISTKSYEIVGYGIDNDLQTARDIAKGEISKTIKVKISSTTNINKSIEDGNYNKSQNSNLSTSSDATLQGIEIVKEENIDGKWYVSAIYDNRSLIQKINIKYPKYNLSSLQNLKNLKLVRKNNNWYLTIKNDLYLLNDNNFKDIFSNIDNKNIIFKSNKRTYKSQDSMIFNIVSKTTGYISILYVEANGKVGVIFGNQNIDKKIVYPKKNAQEQLIAYNPTKTTITEQYICIYSKEKLDLREFENISDNLLDESNYNFDKLLDIIKDKKFSSLKLKIRGL